MFNKIESERKAEHDKIKAEKDQLVVNEEELKEFIEETIEEQNKDVEKVFHLQKQIQQNMDEFQQEVKTHQKVTEQWIQLLDSLEKSLKEFGDFENFLHELQLQAQDLAKKLEQKARG
eukprot:TRINITY_DN5480_c0_g2_i2.p2 TRINITY_DN5480_c0_g2~~TRINITY_DN5480_c0_g2_i2.p2  ORF type:complete len:118 (-),score=27.94 TRINITY_DN5480_c0_g2_i2:69-422(-)